MSDTDFLNDVSASVDNAGVAPSVPNTETTPNETPQGQTPKPITTEPASTALADELSTMFDQEATTDIAGTENKEEKPADEIAGKEQQQPASDEKLEKKADVRQKKKGSEKLLDTFLKEDADGNLINNEGDVIALAGKSRQYYEGLKSEARKQRKAATDLAITNAQLANQFRGLYDEYKANAGRAVDPVQSIVKDGGFSENEAKSAYELIKQWKSNPIEAIKSLLTQAAASGIDVSQIGANVSASPQAIQQQIENALEKHMGPLSNKAEQDALEEASTREANAFLQQYPDAQRYVKQIGEAKTRFPNMSLQEIWLRIDREIQKHANNSSSTMHRKRTPNRRKARTAPNTPKKVTPPVRDYENMDFAAIAQSIKEDYKQ